MTVKDMDDRLEEFCDTVEDCSVCKIKGCNKCTKPLCDVTDDDIKEAYKLVFGEVPEERMKRLGYDIPPSNSSSSKVVDMVNKPPHYTHGMECIDEIILVFGKRVAMNFCLGNVWKYRKRALHKNGIEDIEKSDWYLKAYQDLKSEVEEEDARRKDEEQDDFCY